jgi:uncharacterized protein (TIGR04222 family)
LAAPVKKPVFRPQFGSAFCWGLSKGIKMKTLHNDLWRKIEAYELDEAGVSLPFSRKLGEENLWSRLEVQSAIIEYKRFVFLGLVSGHPVAPSDEIDQVWHLHLTYTKSYWKEWCSETLGQTFHHAPSRGGPEDSLKHSEWYQKTLESYRHWFEEEPPKRFWPTVEERFGPNNRFARVNMDRNWVVPKPGIAWEEAVRTIKFVFRQVVSPKIHDRRVSRAPRSYGILLILPALLLGCNSVLFWDSPLNFRGPDFLDFFWKIWVASLVLAVFLRWRLRWPGDEGMTQVSDLRPDPYLVAYVRGRGVLAGTAAMASLVHANLLEADKTGMLKRTSSIQPSNLHPLQQAVMRQIRGSNLTRVADVRAGIASELNQLEGKAEQAGLLTPPQFRSMARWIPFAVAVSVPILGLVKIIVGAVRDKPVGFLVLLTILAAVVALAGFVRDPHRSRRGSAWLSRIARRNRRLKSRLRGSSAADQSNELALAVGLFGTSVFASLGYATLQQTFTPPAGSSSSGCGGSCGGGGGGGGGGCGGCGGGD